MKKSTQTGLLLWFAICVSVWLVRKEDQSHMKQREDGIILRKDVFKVVTMFYSMHIWVCFWFQLLLNKKFGNLCLTYLMSLRSTN